MFHGSGSAAAGRRSASAPPHHAEIGTGFDQPRQLVFLPALNRRVAPAGLRSSSPSGPAALKRCTQSRSVFRSIAPIWPRGPFLALVCRPQSPSADVPCRCPPPPGRPPEPASRPNPRAIPPPPASLPPATIRLSINHRSRPEGIPFRESPSRAVGISRCLPQRDADWLSHGKEKSEENLSFTTLIRGDNHYLVSHRLSLCCTALFYIGAFGQVERLSS